METINPAQKIPAASSYISTSPLINKDYSKMNIKPLVTILTIAIVLLSLVLLPGQIIKTTSLTVYGTGKVSTTPQSVSLVVTRVNVATDPSLAIDGGESGLITLINEAKNIVGSDAEIQKSFFTTSVVSGQQSVNGQATVIKGLQVTNGFKISFKDVSKTNELIKTLYDKGASSISNVSFVPAEKDKIEQESRKLAIANAKQEADKIAKATGKRVGRMISFADDQTDSSSVISSSQGSFGTENIDIIKAVSVIYEIW